MNKRLPCGGKAYLDHASGVGAYRCSDCFAVIGSMGQPEYCKELMEQEYDRLDAGKAANGDTE